MTFSYLQIVILAAIQGMAELLPVSSSAHVIAIAKLMGIDPSSAEFTLLLVMLHTGTMFAVIVYFWKAWKKTFFASREEFIRNVKLIVLATAVTGVIGLALKLGIESYMRHHDPTRSKAEIEDLFNNMKLVAGGLAAAGVLILLAGLKAQRGASRETVTPRDSLAIGAIQGLCLPFRGFSRSGATISVGLLRGVAKMRLEEFSFALAVVLTPVVVILEGRRLIQHHSETSGPPIGFHDFVPSLVGMAFSFVAGLVALKLLSRLLEKGQWWVFGVYCLVAAVGVLVLVGS